MRRLLLALASCSAWVAHGLEISEGTLEGRAQFIVRTESATWYYDRAGGGFSRLIDRAGHDWIDFSKEPLEAFPAAAAAGYRGIPNAVFGDGYPDAGAGHPGFDRCESSTMDGRTIRTISKTGRWEWTWSFTETKATMTMVRADADHAWWFLYEGPIAGSFAPTNQFWGTDRGGPRADVPDIHNQFFDRFRWVYFGDRATPRVLFLAQHEPDEPDELDDTVWYLGSSDGGAATASDGMMVFGFGRAPGTRGLLTGAGQKFSVGFVETGRDSSRPSVAGEALHQLVGAAVRSALGGQPATE